MKKVVWGPFTALAPVPAVLVTVRGNDGRDNVLTIAWAGTVSSKPPMVSISVRKERFSHKLLTESREFVINLTTEALLRAADHCGVRSGRDEDKFEVMGLHKTAASKVGAPLIEESPLNLECRVTDIIELGSHDLFLARVEAVDVDESLIDEKGKLDLAKAGLVAYVHGAYRSLGKELGTFGFSVRKKAKKAAGRSKTSAGNGKNRPAASENRPKRAENREFQAVSAESLTNR